MKCLGTELLLISTASFLLKVRNATMLSQEQLDKRKRAKGRPSSDDEVVGVVVASRYGGIGLSYRGACSHLTGLYVKNE